MNEVEAADARRFELVDGQLASLHGRAECRPRYGEPWCIDCRRDASDSTSPGCGE